MSRQMDPLALMLKWNGEYSQHMCKEQCAPAREGGVLWVVDLCGERDLGRLERVVGRERDRQEEHSTAVRRVTLYKRMHLAPTIS